MRRFLITLPAGIVVVMFFVGTLVVQPPRSLGEEKECTWGEIKCCYADPPCGTCCTKPKDEGTSSHGGRGAPVLSTSCGH